MSPSGREGLQIFSICYGLNVFACCLFVCGFSSHSRILYSYGDVTIAGEGLNMTNARHSGPLSSECSLACHTYWNTGHPFTMVIAEVPWSWRWPPHLLPSVWQWSCHYLFLRLTSVEAGIRTPNLLLARRTHLIHYAIAAVFEEEGLFLKTRYFGLYVLILRQAWVYHLPISIWISFELSIF